MSPSSQDARKARARRVLSLLLAPVLATSACSAATSDPVLDELIRDPMAARSQRDAALVSGDDIAAASGNWIFSKPRGTQVIRTFQPVGISTDDLLRRARDTAGAAGWQMSGNADDITGSKDFAFGAASLSVYRNTFVDDRQIVLVLRPESRAPST